MNNIFDDNDDAKTLSTDMVMSMLGVMILIVVVLIFHLNPPGDKSESEDEPPGELIIEIRWPDERDIDIDLWSMAPKEISAIGYSNMTGVTMNLLRDDLGHYLDNSKSEKGNFNQYTQKPERKNSFSTLNYENAYSRGLPEGKYTFNVHLFNSREVDGGNRNLETCVPVDFKASIKYNNNKGGTETILTTTNELCRIGEEKTIVSFIINDEGKVDPESINSLQTKIRSLD